MNKPAVPHERSLFGVCADGGVDGSRLAMTTATAAAGSASMTSRLGIALRFAAEGLWHSRRRLVLTLLGVGIGFAAIHALAILGHSAQARLQASLDSLGGDIVTLDISMPFEDMPVRGRPPAPRPAGQLKPGHVDLQGVVRLLQTQPAVAAVGLVGQTCAGSVGGGGALEVDSVSTLSPASQSLLAVKPAQGRLLLPVDHRRGNVVLGAQAYQSLLKLRPHARVGTEVTLCDRRWRIVGVLEPHPGSDLIEAFNLNLGAFELGDPSLGIGTSGVHVLVRLRPGQDPRQAADALRAQVTQLLPGYALRASAAWDVIRVRQEQLALYRKVLAAIGAISLLVGSLGIVNMMLVAVTERRAEIGLRMALGARQADIVLQFAAEGVLICMISSLLGLLVAALGVQALLQIEGIPMLFPRFVILQASALACVCGIASAAYPAYRAAGFDPTECLRGD